MREITFRSSQRFPSTENFFVKRIGDHKVSFAALGVAGHNPEFAASIE
jgi:hypothetical protein